MAYKKVLLSSVVLPLPPNGGLGPYNYDAEKDVATVKEYETKLSGALTRVISQILQAVNELIEGRVQYLKLQVQFEEPKAPQTGWVVFADGTSWNPGSGEGLYEYRSDAAWHKL